MAWNENQLRVIEWRNSNILVSAAAGSGKTAALVERILKLVIKDGIDVNRLIVVTFTKAAASEMKERLSKALYAALDEENEKPDSEEKAEKVPRLENQITLVNTAQICTIDSFCQYIIKNYFYAVEGLDPGFRVVDQDEEKLMLEETLDEVLEEAYKKGDKEFLQLSEAFSSWKNDDGFRNIILGIYNKCITLPQPKRWLKSIALNYDVKSGYFDKYINVDSDDYCGDGSGFIAEILNYIQIRVNHFIECANRGIEILKGTGYDELIDIFEDDIIKLGKVIDAASKKKPYDSVKKALEEILLGKVILDDGTSTTLNDKSFMDFKRFSAKTYGEYREAFYAAKDCRVYAGKKSTDNMLMKYYERFFDLSDIKKMMMLDGESIEDLESCDLIRNRCGKLQPYTDAIVDIVETLYNRFDEVKREAGVVDFNDMEHYALNILTNEDEDGNLVPSDIAKELGSFYRQIMIDEYQDSNLVQEEILSSIAKGNESGTTHMFMVGDVKQSIYSFRHARPELFMGKFDRFEPEELYVGKKPAGESDAAGEDAIAGESDDATEGLEGASKSSENTGMDSYAAAREGKNIRIVLDRNYRSRIGVLEQVNVIFKMLMRKSLGGTSYGEAESLKYGGLFEKGDQSMINTGKPFDLHDYNTELILVETNNRKDLFSDRNDVDNSWMDKRYSGYELEAMAIGKRILEMKNSGLLIADTDENKNEIKRELRFSDIVILLRSAGKEGNKYRNILTNMGIPVSSEGKTGYFDTVEVQIVMNYLKLIDNPIQDIPFVSVLKSSFVGFSDEDLALIEIHSDAKSFYEKALSFINKKGLKGRQIELQIRLKEFVEGLESYRRAARSLSVYDLLSSLYYGEKGFYDIVKCQKGGEQRAANLDVLLQKALEIGSNGNRSILDFTHYIDNLKKKDVDYGEADVTGENADTVKIMTIHKSKGLEFPVVFLGMTGKKFNDMDTRNKVIMDNDLGMAFTDFSFDERFKSEWVYKKFIAANIKRNMKAEEQRVLYVALTRAKEKLIIVGSMDFSAKTTAKNTDPVDVYDTKFEDYFSTFQKAYNTRLLNAEEDNSYYKWILSALYGNSAFTMARAKYKNMMLKKIAVMQKELEPGEERIYEIPEVSVSLEEIKKGAEIKDCLRVGIVSNEMAVKTYEKIKENLPEEERISSSGINDGDFGDAHEGLTERLDRQLHFVYPFANKNKYPSKVSVSALKAASHEDHGYKTADENEAGVLEEQIYSFINDEVDENETFDFTIPSFMKTEAEKKYVPANELGTTYHKLMEMLPFENMEALKDDESVKAYIKSLSDKKLIPVNHSDYIVDNKKLFDFVCGFVHSSSDVLKGMEDASKKRKLYKEQQFMKEYFSRDLEGIRSVDGMKVENSGKDDHKTIVQGIIDAYYIDDDGEIVLVDYKTDGITGSKVTAEVLKDRYKIQFDYYTEALESLSGRKVKERYIYSFKLGEFIRI